MSLRSYRWPRLLVLAPGTTVLDAARALEQNDVGAVLVQGDGRVAGIVTDRDLAIRVVGQGRDPRDTILADIMTTDVVTLRAGGSRTEAVRLMQAHRIRRIPLTDDDDRVDGIVTLDDLLGDESVPLAELARVVRRQIGEGGPAMPARAGEEVEQRRAARLEASHRRLLNDLRTEAGMETLEDADTAFMVVLSALVRRLTPDEAVDLLAQLPVKMSRRLGEVPMGPDKLITPASIEQDLMETLGVERARAAGIIEAVARSLDRHVSAGEMDDVRQQLPKDLRELFTPAVGTL